jgi:hypothetical protein
MDVIRRRFTQVIEEKPRSPFGGRGFFYFNGLPEWRLPLFLFLFLVDHFIVDVLNAL